MGHIDVGGPAGAQGSQGAGGAAGAQGSQGAQGDHGNVELGYAQITSNFTQVATVNTVYDIPGLSVTVTTATRPIMVELWIPSMYHSLANANINLWLYEDGVLINAGTFFLPAQNNGIAPIVKIRRNPAAGSHTYKASIRTPLAGTVTAVAGATYPAYLSAVEV